MPGDVAGAVAALEDFEIPEGGPASFGMFDSGMFDSGQEVLRELGAKVERLAAIVRATPVATDQAITLVGQGFHLRQQGLRRNGNYRLFFNHLRSFCM